VRVALVHRDNPRCIERMGGAFCYDVPEFEVTHFPTAKFGVVDRNELADAGYDVIYYEDGKCWPTFEGDADIPVIYQVQDSTLSEEHYRLRYEKAAEVADLVLVDWDDLTRFEGVGAPVRRLSYSVNDWLFCDYGLERDIDVAFLCHTKDCPARAALDVQLTDLCLRRGWEYESGTRLGRRYAQAFNRARVCVHMERTPTTRAHRVFDVMAARSCLLTSVQPYVSGEEQVAGVHYVDYETPAEIDERLAWLLDSGAWETIADAGHEYVMTHHTWSVRARELRDMIREELGL